MTPTVDPNDCDHPKAMEVRYEVPPTIACNKCGMTWPRMKDKAGYLERMREALSKGNGGDAA